MIQSIKNLVCLGLLLHVATFAKAFSLLGPYEGWQATTLGYQMPYDIGAPKDLTVNEGYRWNLPVITYAFDESFIRYFGTNGMAAVESAISVFNNLPPFSAITNDGHNLYIRGEPVPTDTRVKNHEAETLGVIDLKSFTLSLMLEELGLAAPERWVWSLYNRHVQTIDNVSQTNYTILQFNYDPITLRQSPYVNGVFYSYNIEAFRLPWAYEDAVEVPIDINSTYPYTSVAGFNMNSFGLGLCFSALTHDDIGGLRWLYNRDRLCVENIMSNSIPGKLPTGGSPWMPYFNPTNYITQGTNSVSATNSTNSLVITALRPGINKLQFVRVNFDSMIGQTFAPITNIFEDTFLSNGVYQVQSVQRVITQPDLLFIVDDLGVFNDTGTPVIAWRSDTSGWQNNDAINGQDTAVDAGPGVIQPPVRIRFTQRLPHLIGSPAYFAGQMSVFANGLGNYSSAGKSIYWGSFDGSTNSIVIYPDYSGVTVDDLRNYAVQGGNR